ncbi:hypothetical protein IEO21_06586 [Rhodonia placenta]|uniref:CID domain-containing protein n=1 Tax=Rhodonia placenta TaxID=104341 RepID=A0A8H7NZR6_9APHY|nr:hypothetical protein IEO21_06586 [Postia placenta]
MDPFEVRIQFLSLLRKLNASQQSIQKIVGYALKFFSGCGEDLWDCLVEECQKGSINNRINILYLLDSLCEASLIAKSHSGALSHDGSQNSFYVDYVARDLSKVVESVVPEGRQGLPNLMSTKQVLPLQILESWRSKRVIDPQKCQVPRGVGTLCNMGMKEIRVAMMEWRQTMPTPSTSLLGQLVQETIASTADYFQSRSARDSKRMEKESLLRINSVEPLAKERVGVEGLSYLNSRGGQGVLRGFCALRCPPHNPNHRRERETLLRASRPSCQ